MNFLLFLFKTLKKIAAKFLEILLIATVAVLVLDVLWGVFSRYILNASSSWTGELASNLLIWVVLLGGAYAFGEKAHLGVDYLMEKFDIFSQKMTTIFINIVAIFFAASVFIHGGYQEVSKAFKIEQMLPALGIEKGYVYLALPITGVFFVMFGIEAIFEEICKFKNDNKADDLDGVVKEINTEDYKNG